MNPLITGIGLCTPLGSTTPSTWDALLAGRFITDHSRIPGVHSETQPRINTLALRAAHEAIDDAGWTRNDLDDAALIVGTSKGPVDAWLDREEKRARMAAGELGPLFGLSETATFVASVLSLSGPRLTLSAACASGLVAIIRAAMMIRTGEVQRAIVVAAESSLHPLFLASFQRLGVLPPAGNGCRPFDHSRAGFVVSEAAAAICLETATGLTRRQTPTLAIDRFAFGADATHLTGGDANAIALRHILRQVFDGRELDLIHAHGTGTIANDPIELAAIESCLQSVSGARPTLYSHKGALGHSLGAAGLVTLCINCLCHRHGVIPPNVQTQNALETERVKISQDRLQREVKRSIAIAAGFGGAIAAVSIASAAQPP